MNASWNSRILPAIAIAGAVCVAAAPGLAQPRAKPAAEQVAPGTVWREASTGMQFVFVPGGEFEQGCGAWTGDCSTDAKPSRKVKLGSFWIAKHEVTQDEWRIIMGVNPAQQRPGARYPVERVSWIQAQQFIHKLSQESGNGKFRLPTEAEWEYACRAGGKPLLYGTSTGKLDRTLANYGSDSCCGRDASDGFSESAEVGHYPGNSLGIFDMTGNLWEWVQDNYDGSAYLSGRAVNPVVNDNGPVRVVRGGSFTASPSISRCTDRRDMGEETRYFDLGFRLVRVVDPSAKKAKPAANEPPPDPRRAPVVLESPDQLPGALAPKSNWQKWAREHGMSLEKCC